MIAYKDFKHVIPIQIRFSDIDKLNHVNNACYLNYIELGRVSYFKEALKDSINWQIEGFILARTELDHLGMTLLNDDIYCATKVESIGNKSLTIRNVIFKLIDGAVIETADCKGILVAMDYKNNLSIPVPEKWKKLFEEFEGR